MEQEEKDLLLKDLCGRLPYHTICYSTLKEENFELSDVSDCDTDYPTFEYGWFDLDEVKPYLFPLSSMTEEQQEELKQILEVGWTSFDCRNKVFYDMGGESKVYLSVALRAIEFFNKNHFDYNGLIKRELAIDCTNLNVYV